MTCGRARIRQHVPPQFQLRGVHGHVQRAQPLLLEPLPVSLRQVGQRHEVAVQEAEPVVVVLRVERLPHAFGQALEEAEEAVVVAKSDVVPRGALELQPEVFVDSLFEQ